MEDGGYICQLFNNGFDAHGSIPFNSFKLRFKNTELTLADSIVRTVNRKVLPPAQVVTEDTPPSVQSTSQFVFTPLDYAYIKTEGN